MMIRGDHRRRIRGFTYDKPWFKPDCQPPSPGETTYNWFNFED